MFCRIKKVFKKSAFRKLLHSNSEHIWQFLCKSVAICWSTRPHTQTGDRMSAVGLIPARAETLLLNTADFCRSAEQFTFCGPLHTRMRGFLRGNYKLLFLRQMSPCAFGLVDTSMVSNTSHISCWCINLLQHHHSKLI